MMCTSCVEWMAESIYKSYSTHSLSNVYNLPYVWHESCSRWQLNDGARASHPTTNTHTHTHSITVRMEHEHFENPFLERHSCHCFKQFHILSIYRLTALFFLLFFFSFFLLFLFHPLTLWSTVNLFSYPSRSMHFSPLLPSHTASFCIFLSITSSLFFSFSSFFPHFSLTVCFW